MVQSVITIRQAMKALNKTSEKCLLVVDEDKKLLGTLSDGDLRRSILGGAKVSEDISGRRSPWSCGCWVYSRCKNTG